MKKKIFCISFALVLILSLSLVTAVPAMAADHDVYPVGLTPIQDAIDVAVDGDVIYVHEGIYSENVIIDGVDVSLVAVGAVTIDGATDGYYDRTIFIRNSTCTIDGFNVKHNGSAIYARGMGALYGDGEVNVTIKNNYVTDYIKNGITVNGELATGIVMGNTIESDADSVYAQNGIQFGYGATGKAHHNTVITDWYEGENWTACGILIFEANGVSVKRNSVSNAQTGIGIEAWGYLCPSANDNTVSSNIIDNSDWGISVSSISLTWSYMDSSANNNKVVNNIISDTTGDNGQIGIYVGAYISDTFPPTTVTSIEAVNNKVIHNNISGFVETIVSEGTLTKVRSNIPPYE